MFSDEASEFPPTDTLPARFGPTGVLLHTSRVAMFVDRFRVWPSGCTFSLVLALAPALASDPERPLMVHFMGYGPGEEHEFVEVTVDLADGQRRSSHPDTPDPQRLVTLRGGGAHTWWESAFWLTPLPPEPDMTITATWPGGNASGSIRLPTAQLNQQARHSIALW